MTDISTTFGGISAGRETQTFGLSAFAALATRIAEALRVRRDLALLKACDDRMLADIGLTRGQIDGAVRYGRRH